jgi:RNA polymerase sigma-70 factor (ECF subfamily)
VEKERLNSDRRSEPAHGREAFVTTHWSVVLAAQRAETPIADAALAHLCQSYWYPLYAYVRRRGYGPEDAQDLTQEFFARLLRKNWLGQADQQRGRFRTFLLSALSHFLANEWDRARARKRGGAFQLVPLELGTVETRFSREPADTATPEQIYERRWAIALLDQVLERLGKDYEEQGGRETFELLKPCLVGDREKQPYADLSLKLGMSEGALKVLVHRLRKRYRELLRDEIANTVASQEEVEDEMRHLLHSLSSAG